MTSEQFLYLISIVAFLAGASAILKTRTMQNTIDRQGELLDVNEKSIAAREREIFDKDRRILALETQVTQQQQQIEVLTNTVNSSDLIRALDEHLAAHHKEAMEKLDRQHRDFVSLRSLVSEALK